MTENSSSLDGCASIVEANDRRSGSLKATAVVGMIVLTPIAASFLVASWVMQFLSAIPGDQFFHITKYKLVNTFVKGGLVIALSGIAVVGAGKIFSTRHGSVLERRIDTFFMRLPFFSTVYSVTKTAADTVFRKTDDFKHPVKIPFDGVNFTGFRTGKATDDGRQVVFVPTSPNITSGFVVEVEQSRIENADENLESALKRVLSAGFSN